MSEPAPAERTCPALEQLFATAAALEQVATLPEIDRPVAALLGRVAGWYERRAVEFEQVGDFDEWAVVGCGDLQPGDRILWPNNDDDAGDTVRITRIMWRDAIPTLAHRGADGGARNEAFINCPAAWSPIVVADTRRRP